jgi:hypothetical protein
VIETKEGETRTLACDTVMVVSQYGRNDALYEGLANVVVERYLIGDAQSAAGPTYIHGAIRNGAQVGLAV